MNGIDMVIGVFGLLAIFLSFTGTTIGESTLAFGGDRWNNNNAPFYTRITLRGWIVLLCVSVAIGMIALRKDLKDQAIWEKTSQIATLEENALRLEEQIKKYVTDIVQLKKELNTANEQLAHNSTDIETHQMQSINAAFQLTTNLYQELDEAVVHLDGRPRVPVPSRFLAQMRLAGGDRFYFATFLQNITPRDLQSIQLEMGSKTYSLFEGTEKGFFERTLRLPGNPLRTVPAVILNPLLLNRLSFKVVVRPKEILPEEDPFRQLIINNPFSKIARQKYKHTTADILNVRGEASASSILIERLRRGSYVHILSTKGDWVEVQTAKGKQGWVLARFLATIK